MRDAAHRRGRAEVFGEILSGGDAVRAVRDRGGVHVSVGAAIPGSHRPRSHGAGEHGRLSWHPGRRLRLCAEKRRAELEIVNHPITVAWWLESRG